MKNSWNGFAKKSIEERLELVKAQALTSLETQKVLSKMKILV